MSDMQEHLLQFLAGHPAGRSTPQLADLLRDEVQPWQAALTRVGGVMRRNEAAGRVHRAGTVPGRHQQGPAVIWQITEAGADYLAKRQARPKRQASRKQRKRDTVNGTRYGGPQVSWMCGPCWQGVADNGQGTVPVCPNCGRSAQRPGDVKFWTDEEWAVRTGLPVSERAATSRDGVRHQLQLAASGWRFHAARWPETPNRVRS